MSESGNVQVYFFAGEDGAMYAQLFFLSEEGGNVLYYGPAVLVESGKYLSFGPVQISISTDASQDYANGNPPAHGDEATPPPKGKPSAASRSATPPPHRPR